MKNMSLILTVVLVAAMTAPAFAMPKMVERAKDGATEILRSPLHVHDSARDEAKSAKFMPFGLVGGILKGTADMGKDILKGSFKVVTAPTVYLK